MHSVLLKTKRKMNLQNQGKMDEEWKRHPSMTPAQMFACFLGYDGG